MADGILVIDKPSDWTSHDVVAKLRGIFDQKKVGHGGTLDPMATGVLPVFFGRGTRAASIVENATKEYIAELVFGRITNTQDTGGEVLETRPVDVSEGRLRAVLKGFEGLQEQMPPMYSAIKKGGKKLYELARRGIEVERKPREIVIYELELLSFHESGCTLRLLCSKGTYVRTLCHDLGMRLGCGAAMSALRRSRAGIFTLSQALTLDRLEKLKARGEHHSALLPIDSLFTDYAALMVSEAAEFRLRNGAVHREASTDEGSFRLYSVSGEFLGIGSVKAGLLRLDKGFFAL